MALEKSCLSTTQRAISSSASSSIPMSSEQPTDEELRTLRKVSGKIPFTAYGLCMVEFAERAAYHGCSQVFSNFVEFPLPKNGNGAGAPPRRTQETAGALDRGEQTTFALYVLFVFLTSVIPVAGAIIADTKLGRYNTICIGIIISGIAHVVFVFGALPSVLQAGNGFAPFLVSLIVLALGAGLFKPNMSPVILDQCPDQTPYIAHSRTGERVIVDPETTVQRMMLAYYLAISVGAFFGIATTYAEKDVGYWLSFLISAVVYLLCPVILIAAYKRIIKRPPQANVLVDFFRVITFAFKQNGLKRIGREGYLDVTRPSHIASSYQETLTMVKWTDTFVTDVGRTLEVCQIFLFFIIYNINSSGLANLQQSQASAMRTNGAPNDLLSNFQPLVVVFAIPVLNYIIYPFLRQHRIPFPRITRITVGFCLAALSPAIGAILQWRIYQTSPCGYHATRCRLGTHVSHISVWAQIPMFVLQGLSECFASVTAYELAYARAPKHMRSVVTALFLFTGAISSAVSLAVEPALKDPHLVWPFAGTSVAGFLVAGLFWWVWRRVDGDAFMTGEDDERRGVVEQMSPTTFQEGYAEKGPGG